MFWCKTFPFLQWIKNIGFKQYEIDDDKEENMEPIDDNPNYFAQH